MGCCCGHSALRHNEDTEHSDHGCEACSCTAYHEFEGDPWPFVCRYCTPDEVPDGVPP